MNQISVLSYGFFNKYIYICVIINLIEFNFCRFLNLSNKHPFYTFFEESRSKNLKLKKVNIWDLASSFAFCDVDF